MFYILFPLVLAKYMVVMSADCQQSLALSNVLLSISNRVGWVD